MAFIFPGVTFIPLGRTAADRPKVAGRMPAAHPPEDKRQGWGQEMSGEAPESRGGQAPSSPGPAVQPAPSGTNDGAPHVSGHVHAHRSAIQFRFLEQLKRRNVIPLARRPPSALYDVVAVVVGLGLYVAMIYGLHRLIIGVPLLGS